MKTRAPTGVLSSTQTLLLFLAFACLSQANGHVVTCETSKLNCTLKGAGMKLQPEVVCNENCTLTECCKIEVAETNIYLEVSIQILVWICTFGLSASVDFVTFKKRFRSKGILIGLACQFFLLPAMGYGVVTLFKLKPLHSIILLIIVSSPGGSYSNWWCSLFNADLALSVAMTTVSSILSCAMLPFNILIYVQMLYVNMGDFGDLDVTSMVDYKTIGLTLANVISAIVLGIFFGKTFPSLQDRVNKIANMAGFVSLFMGVFVSSTSDEPPWAQTWDVYVAVCLPLIGGIVGSFVIASIFKLPKPQTVAVSIETAFQNINIATAVSFSIPGGTSATVIAVIYGGYEATIFAIFCFTSWKMGWTFAPANDPFCKVITNNYQVDPSLNPDLAKNKDRDPEEGDFAADETEELRATDDVVELSTKHNAWS